MRKLSLKDWSSIAEILSSIAVLVTLVFLVFELRQNTDSVRANTYQHMNAVISDLNGIFLANPDVSEFVARTASVDSPIEPHDAVRLRAFISSQYRHVDNVYFQYRIGTIDRRQMESLLYPVILNFHRRSRLRWEWENGPDRLILDPELVAYFDEALQALDSEQP